GNVIDPLDIADTYGADALRFTLAAMPAQVRDIKLAMSRVEGYRNFSTKLWNAARFAEMNNCQFKDDFHPKSVNSTLSRWIASELQITAAKVGEGIEEHRYNEAAGALYHFIWHIFCDWYLELAKPVLSGDENAEKSEARAMTAWVLEQVVRLLHPFMPFITEEIWQQMKGQGADNMLISAPWPQISGLENEAAASEISWVIDLVTNIRSARAEMNVPAGARIPLVLIDADETVRDRCRLHDELIQRLARLSELTLADQSPKGAIQIVVDGATAALPLGDVLDFAAERDRLQREIAKTDDEIRKLAAKLANEKFTTRAPAHVVEEQVTRKQEAEETRAKLNAAMDRFAD
ncbi:MAG: class I tRNA ligase family protein, partial [Fimbriimonadaceae bacterium]|nr:class I tRNA ligase family protein [Alphaproteobacteria bacterium]